MNGEPSGPALKAVPLGSMVSVTLQITSPDDIDSAVNVESWVPAGLEPLDPNVASTGATSSGNGCEQDFAGGGRFAYFYGWWWYCPSFQRETKTDRVVYYFPRGIRAGTRTLSYEAVAATVGQFTLPPAQALIVTQPEVLGLSAGGTFTVSAGQLTAADMALPVASAP